MQKTEGARHAKGVTCSALESARKFHANAAENERELPEREGEKRKAMAVAKKFDTRRGGLPKQVRNWREARGERSH